MQISPDERVTNFVHSPTSFDFMQCLSPYKASSSGNNHYKLPPLPQQQQQNNQLLQKQQNNYQHQKHQNNQLPRSHQSNTNNLLGSTTLDNTISLKVMSPRKNKRPLSSEQGPINLDEDDDNGDDRVHFQNGDSMSSTQRKFPMVSAQTFFIFFSDPPKSAMCS
jgi:hypothetical protein